MIEHPDRHRVHVALVEDEPLITDALGARIREWNANAMVSVFDRPRRLRVDPDVGLATHAVVDLSFGRHDFDRAALAREAETGVDAIDALREDLAPHCSIAVATRIDTADLLEMAVAIRQTWPEIRFLHKADAGVAHRVVTFVADGMIQDNAEIGIELEGIDPVPPRRIRAALESIANSATATRIVLALAHAVDRPTMHELAASLGNESNFIRRLITDIGESFRQHSVLRLNEPGGLERLWRWCRARRAVLVRLFPPAPHARERRR